MHKHNRTHNYRAATVALTALVVSISMLSPGCDDGGGEPGPADFYVTVKLNTGFHPQAVDVLDVVLALTDATLTFDDSEGSQYEDGITWETRLGSSGDELHVEVSGDYFEANAMEVSTDTFEIDIPFNGGREEVDCNIRATARWHDLDGMLVDIGYGTGRLELPVAEGTRVPVEVICHGDYGWTCRTGCDPAMQDCPEGVEDCGTGLFECIEGCCEPAD